MLRLLLAFELSSVVMASAECLRVAVLEQFIISIAFEAVTGVKLMVHSDQEQSGLARFR